MKTTSIFRTGTWIALALSLSGCIESEKKCYDRLLGELDSLYNTGEKMRNDPNTMSTDSQIRDVQIAIGGQKSRLYRLYLSDSVSVCDFYVDGIRLVQK